MNTGLTWAVVLCGGRARRMGEIAQHCAKVLLEIQARPMLWYQFQWLHRNGVTDVILPLGHLGEQIEHYVQDLEDFADLRIWCVHTGENSSISQRLCQIRSRIVGQEHVLLINGDTLADFDIAPMFELHVGSQAAITTTAMRIKSPSGLMQLEGDLVRGFVRDQPIDSMRYQGIDYAIHGGHSILSMHALRQLDAGDSDDFELRFYDHWARHGALRCYQPPGWFQPVDNEKDLAAAQTMTWM